MKSLDLFGKYWLLPDGEIVDVTTDEHARIARAAMLNLLPTTIPYDRMFLPLTSAEQRVHAARGVDRARLDFLSTPHPDARVYVIREHGWIRTRGNMFYAWEWNDATLAELLGNKKFWALHPKVNQYTSIVLINVKDEKQSVNCYGTIRSMETAPC